MKSKPNGGRDPHLTDSLYSASSQSLLQKAILHNNRYFCFSKRKTKQAIPAILQDKDKDSSYDESKASTSASVSGDGVAMSRSTLWYLKAGTYVIPGESDGVQIKVRVTQMMLESS